MRSLPESREVQELSVEYFPTEFDLIDFRIKLGEQLLEDRFSAVFDPLPAFRSWLEAVAVGVTRCSFWFDDEGRELEFEFEQTSFNEYILRISHYYADPGEPPLLCGFVDPRAMVEAFYRPFLKLDGNPQIIASWERYRYWEIISPESQMTLDETVEFALGLSAAELSAKFGVPPPEDQFCPNAEGVGELVGGSDFYQMPAEFDSWPDEKRRAFLNELLTITFDNSGTPIRDFRSAIVEEFIGEPSEIVVAHKAD